MNGNIVTLHELNERIKHIIENGFPETYLVTAEIASQRTDQKGHCYLDLTERDKEFIIAQIRATVWSSRFRFISQQFKEATGMSITKGIKILAEVEVSFHERYGLSLNIIDIDPSYTLGEMALKRKEILERLSREGLLDRNKHIEFPILPLKLAVISSAHAAGYEDFINQINNNPFGYSYHTRLFSALMQGDRAEESIVSALNKCSEKHERFDLIVIIRGGGGDADLHCFDSYEIGKSIAMMPVPVISGIGHHRDRTVVDEAANTTVKTPTAAAELIVHTVRNYELKVDELQKRFIHTARAELADRSMVLYNFSRDIEHNSMRFMTIEEGALNNFRHMMESARKVIAAHYERLNNHKIRCVSFTNQKVRENRHAVGHLHISLRKNAVKIMVDLKRSLQEMRKHMNLLDPENILKRGYSITYKNGSLVKDIQNISAGDIIKTVLHEGEIKSTVFEVQHDGEEKTAEV